MGIIYDNLELLGPRVLVRPLPDVEYAAGGLIVKPDTARHMQNRGVVEKVGPGEMLEPITCALCGGTGNSFSERDPVCKRCNGVGSVHAKRLMSLAVGDLVFYQKYAGTYVVLDDVERLMLLEDEVQGRLPAAFVELVVHTAAEAADLERRVRAISADGQGPTLSATEHLGGEPCLICSEALTIDQREIDHLTARCNLQLERERLLSSSS